MRAGDAGSALAARFAEPNRRLEALLGRDLGWGVSPRGPQPSLDVDQMLMSLSVA